MLASELIQFLSSTVQQTGDCFVLVPYYSEAFGHVVWGECKAQLGHDEEEYFVFLEQK